MVAPFSSIMKCGLPEAVRWYKHEFLVMSGQLGDHMEILPKIRKRTI